MGCELFFMMSSAVQGLVHVSGSSTVYRYTRVAGSTRMKRSITRILLPDAPLEAPGIRKFVVSTALSCASGVRGGSRPSGGSTISDVRLSAEILFPRSYQNSL